jgi:hypothetical protein
MEECRKDGRPVWRHRSAEYRPDAHEKYVRTLLDRLSELEASTRPSRGPKSEKGKDLAALQALELAGKLIEAVAGWAIDHQIGLALEGRSFVPLQPMQTKEHRDYLEARQQADSHRHEREGGAVLTGVAMDRLTTEAKRLALMNLLLANSGGFPVNLSRELREGLVSLQAGFQTQIMRPATNHDHYGPIALECQMRALEYIEYQVKSKKRPKAKAQEKAAAAFSVSAETIRTWEKRLRERLGRLTVSRRLAFVANHASHGDRDTKFGDAFLEAAAADFKLSQMERK